MNKNWKIRIYEIASIVGMTNGEMIEIAQISGCSARSHSSTLRKKDVEEVLKTLSRLGLIENSKAERILSIISEDFKNQ